VGLKEEGGFGGCLVSTATDRDTTGAFLHVFTPKPKFWRKGKGEGGWDLFWSIIPFLSFIFGRHHHLLEGKGSSDFCRSLVFCFVLYTTPIAVVL
jgi:hypothetical protein